MEIDEETIIKYYLQRGFSYEENIHFLAKRHDHERSYSTLLRRLKTYGLKRRDFSKVDVSGEVLEAGRQRIIEIINGPGSCGGYRTVWHTLKMEGLNVPRIIVQDTCILRGRSRRLPVEESSPVEEKDLSLP